MTWDEFCNGAKKAAEKAADKINRTADLAALQVKLAMAEKKLNDAYAVLGRASYLHFETEEDNTDAVVAACAGVDRAQAVCNKLKAQIAEMEAANKQEKTEGQAATEEDQAATNEQATEE